MMSPVAQGVLPMQFHQRCLKELMGWRGIDQFVIVGRGEAIVTTDERIGRTETVEGELTLQVDVLVIFVLEEMGVSLQDLRVAFHTGILLDDEA